MAENKSPKKTNAQPFAYPILFMIGLSALLAFCLAYLNQSTYAVIKEQEDLAVQKSILYALNVPYGSDEEVKDMIQNNLQERQIDTYTYYEYKENGEVLGYAFPIHGKALWGTVEGYGAVDREVATLLGVDFVKHSETPGLGGRISEDWYKDQFRGIDISADAPYIAYRPAAGGNVDAITGATLTSNSIRDMVNDSIDEFKIKIREVSK